MNEMIKKANELKKESGLMLWTRFRSCQAYTSQVLEDHYYLIRSYNTIVGLADGVEEKVYEFGKYSSTTSKQFTQICNTYFRGFDRVFINETNW